jgi:D-alanyl-D-alanine dipeptidase
VLPLFICFFAFAQPDEHGKQFRPPDLVEIVTLDSTIKLDIRYATANNFTNRRMYTQARAFLQRPAAEALVRANKRLQAAGFGVVVFDAYRPWSVTKKFWDETPPEKRDFVANPREGSRHNRGGAVDVSLYRLSTGEEVPMPSEYDEFSVRASPDYGGGSAAQRRTRDLLRRIMEGEGFTVERNEWWHFNYRDWQSYQILNIPFEELK